MINAYTNPYGVFACISPKGIHLSYSVDSHEQIEMFFSSLKSALQILEVTDIDELTGLALASRFYQNLAAA